MNKKRMLKQLLLASLLAISLALLSLPGGSAQAATTPAATPAQVQPQTIVSGNTFKGISAVPCNLGNNEVFYAYTGTDGHLNLIDQYTNQGGTTSTNSWTYSDTSNSNPSITCWRGAIWVAFEDSNSAAIHVGDATNNDCIPGIGTCQLTHGNIIPNQGTYGTPAIGANGLTLYVAWKGTNNTAMTVEETTTGTSWFDRTVIAGNTTSAEPSLTSLGGHLVLAWAGTDSPAHVNFAAYADGNGNLSNKVKASDTTKAAVGQAAIGVSSYNGRLQVAFQASGGSNQIYTGSWGSTTGYVRNGPLSGAFTDEGPGLAGLNVYFTDTDSRINEVQMPG